MIASTEAIGAREGRRIRPGTLKVCEKCRRPYAIRADRATQSRFCSRRCASAGHIKHHPKRCGQCKCMFKPESSTTQFCSAKCKQAASRRRGVVECGYCRNAFQQSQPRDRYCSRECSRAGMRIRCQKHARPPQASPSHAMLDYAPDDYNRTARWLASLDDAQLSRVWVAAIVEQFGDGKRAALSECLRLVRSRLEDGGKVHAGVPDRAPVLAVDEHGDAGDCRPRIPYRVLTNGVCEVGCIGEPEHGRVQVSLPHAVAGTQEVS